MQLSSVVDGLRREGGGVVGNAEVVYVVDDDPCVLDALSSLLRANGKSVRLFASGAEFLAYDRVDTLACLLLDLNMPGMSGLEIQKLVSARSSIPVVFMTGIIDDVPSAVEAMKGGAIDFLTKPVDEASVLTAVETAFERVQVKRRQAAEQNDLLERYSSLTRRERQVLPMLASGLLNKQVAADLGITEYTVQIHRGNVMRKMKADSFAALVRFAEKVCPELASEVARNG